MTEDNPTTDQKEQLTRDAEKRSTLSNKFSQALNDGLAKNTLGQYSLNGQLLKASAAVTQMNKVFITVGQGQMLSISKRFDTFDMFGLSMDESMSLFSEMAKRGIDFQDKTSKATLRMTTNLGLNVGQMANLLAFNTQTLGLGSESSNRLARGFIDIGIRYKLSTDVLTGAMASLAKTLIQTSVTYGVATTEAVELAMAEMIGMYGAANKELVQAAFQQVYGGTAEASKTAVMMGIGLERLVSTNQDVIISTMQEVFRSLKSKTDPSTGQPGSGFVVPGLIEALNGSNALAQMGKLTPLTEEALALQAEDAEAQLLSNSLNKSFETIMKNFTVILMPFLTSIAGVVAWVTDLLFSSNVVMNMIWTGLASWMISNKLMQIWHKLADMRLNKVQTSIWFRLGFTNRLLNGLLLSNSQDGIPIWSAIFATVVTASTFAAMSAASMSTTADENEKQTKLLSKKDPNTSLLSQIANAMNENNIYSELISRLTQDQIDALAVVATTSPSTTTTLNGFNFQSGIGSQSYNP